MSLTLYYHPLASFCHKVLMALYENDTPFTAQVVDLMNKDSRASYLELWPVGKIPVLRDDQRDRTIPETTIMLEYLEQHYPGAQRLFPQNAEERLDARLWDRFFDCYVQVPMSKIVIDRLWATGDRDPRGVAEARANLKTAYGMLESRLATRKWMLGETFSIADCSAAPALFYAGIVEPFGESYKNVAAYFERLLERPSFKRVLVEARPYFVSFPYKELMPARFLEGE